MADANGNLHDHRGRFTVKSVHDYEGAPLNTERTAYLVATSPEDDAAYIALNDIAGVLAKHPGSQIIGGHMVSVITAAYPAPGLIDRRTGDADAGIPVELANTGIIHDELITAGYEAESGNRYVKPGPDPKPTIDLLIPSLTGQFRPDIRGERGFDSMPGLGLALIRGLNITVNATLRDGTELVIPTPVPTVEAAVILKAYAWSNRGSQTPKDVIDLSNLLHVLDEHGPELLGGWRLGEEGTDRVATRRRPPTPRARERTRRRQIPQHPHRRPESCRPHPQVCHVARA